MLRKLLSSSPLNQLLKLVFHLFTLSAFSSTKSTIWFLIRSLICYDINIFPGNLGGYADFTQTDPRPIKDAENKEECLIKIDSNLGHGIMIGDSGIIFSFIDVHMCLLSVSPF